MSVFQFQQFSVHQSRSAMKVCTDATLFGAMMPLTPGERVLDIGSGTGLLSLMAAQLGAGSVTAVELSEAAWSESQENFRLSPWSDRLTAVNGDICSYAQTVEKAFDLIISNPPFFHRHSPAAERQRHLARHTDQLTYPALLEAMIRLAHPDTRLYLLLPQQAIASFIGLASAQGFHLVDRVDFRGYAHNRSKVGALTLSRSPRCFTPRLLTIYRSERIYSAASERYLADFLLRFAAKQ